MRICIGLAFLAIFAFSGVVGAQTCQRIGDTTFCDNGVTATRIGNSTFYQYDDPRQEGREQRPSASTRIGDTNFYDNGETATDVGDTRFFSNGTTRQRIGDTDFYSNGKTCTNIGSTRFCN